MQINADYDGVIELFTIMRRGAPTVEELGELCRLVIALQINGHLEIGALLRELRLKGADTLDPDYGNKCRKLDGGVIAHQHLSALRHAIEVEVESLIVDAAA